MKGKSLSLHSQLASFLRFMAANLSFTQLVTWAKPQKPAIYNIEGNLLRRPPQGWQPVQMLDQHHLEQHHGICARPAISSQYSGSTISYSRLKSTA